MQAECRESGIRYASHLAVAQAGSALSQVFFERLNPSFICLRSMFCLVLQCAPIMQYNYKPCHQICFLQVMAREIFNPNFSLFVQVPEHGTTFQPNANSVVQNDEARGTNHLDFFKFVGRIIGKALYDGQLIDAFFTRSFYKHMLGDPLTYEVLLPLLLSNASTATCLLESLATVQLALGSLVCRIGLRPCLASDHIVLLC